MSTFMLCVVLTFVLTSNAFILKCCAAEHPVGQWMQWSPWSTCTEEEYCFEGTRERYRDCELGKRCVGIEAESEMCPDTSCEDRPLVLDMAHAESSSFIADECKTSKKFHVRGKFRHIMKHDIIAMFPRAKTMLENCYFNVKVTAKTLPEEKDIYRYCFEPEDKKMSLNDFKSFIAAGTLRFRFTSLQCPFEPRQLMYVSGFTMGFQEDGQPYGLYIQVKGLNGFKSVYYKHMPGSYSSAYQLIWS